MQQKMKTKRSAAKRFKVTGTGKLMNSKAFKRHKLSSKSKTRKNRLGKQVVVDKTFSKTMKKILPYI